jgi:predicted NUDIX family phosphoesterase
MKNEKFILVVEKSQLFGSNYFEGFRPQSEIDYASRILSHFTYMKRGLAEQDPRHKQPIGYSIIVNPALKKIFAYQRASHDAKYGEKRLQGKWSWGVGGHIEKIDTDAGNPLEMSMQRELEEEVSISGSITPKILGYINNDSDEVGKVHFGVLHIVETDATSISPKDAEIDNGKLRTIAELEKICASPDYKVEEWSRIALEPLKQYFRSS